MVVDASVELSSVILPSNYKMYSSKGHEVFKEMEVEVALGASAEIFHVKAICKTMGIVFSHRRPNSESLTVCIRTSQN